MKYRKLPVVIEAFKWTGDQDQTEDPLWIIDAIKTGIVRFIKGGYESEFSGRSYYSPGYMIIKTLEGEMKANIGDYIIKGVKGEIYPCKPDIFEATYELEEK
jgi:hypothetical protein